MPPIFADGLLRDVEVDGVMFAVVRDQNEKAAGRQVGITREAKNLILVLDDQRQQ
jgi:hypothetical protein